MKTRACSAVAALAVVTSTLLVACGAGPLYPTPTLTPAVGFTNGVSEVPEGFRIFLEYKHRSDPHWDECPRVVQQLGVPEYATSFYFDGDRLHALSPCWQTGECYPRAVLIRDCYHPNSADVAEGDYWCQYKAIDTLPAAIGEVGIVLRAIDKEGTVVVEIEGQPYYICSGGHWQRMIETTDNYAGETCDHTQTTSLTNYGLIANDEIAIETK